MRKLLNRGFGGHIGVDIIANQNTRVLLRSREAAVFAMVEKPANKIGHGAVGVSIHTFAGFPQWWITGPEAKTGDAAQAFLLCSLLEPASAERLTPASPDDLADALAFALRLKGRKWNHDAAEFIAQIVAKRLVDHLELRLRRHEDAADRRQHPARPRSWER
jgi:hypothetical protein